MKQVRSRVKETSTTTGTGTLDLAGAVAGFQGFVASGAVGSEIPYLILGEEGSASENEWEEGEGTITDASPDTLARDTVFESSNSDNLVNFSAGTKRVFLTYPAKRMRTVGPNFPSSPLTDAVHYHTGRRIEYFYDGTQWLSTQIFSLQFPSFSGISATAGASSAYPWPGLYSIYILYFDVAHTLNTTGNWTAQLFKHTDVTSTAIGSGITVTNTGDSYDSTLETINAVVASTVNLLFWRATENSGSALFSGHALALYRLIG